MVLKEVQNKINKLGEGKEDAEKLVISLYEIIETQNKIIYELKNNYIRLENSIGLCENKIEQNEAYKRLCNLILNKIGTNPISALWFLYSIKKKIEEYNKKGNSI